MEEVINVEEKAAKVWLDSIKDTTIKNAALKNAEANGNLQTMYQSLTLALFKSFRFNHSEEGFDYWERALEKVRRQKR